MATINPRTLFQTFLNTPKPSVVVSGASRPGQPSAVGAGIWQINPKATFNGNTNSVPVVLHNVSSNRLNSLVFPGYFDTAIWFDFATGAVIGVSTYGSNWGSAAPASVWILDTTKNSALPTSATVNYTTTASVWTSSGVNATFKAPVGFPLTGEYNPYLVGSTVSLPTGRTLRITANLSTVGTNNIIRLRYTLSWLTNGTPTPNMPAENFDFYFNVTTGFIFADFPEEIIQNVNGTYSKIPTNMRWTVVSGF